MEKEKAFKVNNLDEYDNRMRRKTLFALRVWFIYSAFILLIFSLFANLNDYMGILLFISVILCLLSLFLEQIVRALSGK